MKRYFLSLFFSFTSCFAFSTNEVIYIWSGGVTPNAVNVKAKMTDTSSTIRLVLSTSPQFISPIYSVFYSVDSTTNWMVAMSVSGLTPQTKYYYAVESGGVLDSSVDDVGSFTTFTLGYCSYYFATGSCCLNSNHVVYDVMKNSEPLFFSCIGDLHYVNPNSGTDINVHRNAYENAVLSQPAAADFYKQVPIEYVWDDHDFSGNDSDSSFAGKENARIAYREYVPHYPLPAGAGNNAIYQTFTVGRVHFIHTDLRSDRYGSSMMGTQQKAWFKNECLLARDNREIIAWISSSTWNGTFLDNWGGYPVEREELAEFFRDSMITNMFILCGDAHMLAIDDGSHGEFSTLLTNPSLYPIFNAAALNMTGGYKGGTFSEGGYFPNPTYNYGQFGIVSVVDSGGNSICISFSGYRTDSIADQITLINNYTFCRDLGVSPNANMEIAPRSGKQLFYPNPNSGKFTFETDEEFDEAIITVTDISGRTFEPVVEVNSNGRKIDFDLSTYSSGIYFVRVVSDKKNYERRIVICN